MIMMSKPSSEYKLVFSQCFQRGLRGGIGAIVVADDSPELSVVSVIRI
jgi:hypothetical protein